MSTPGQYPQQPYPQQPSPYGYSPVGYYAQQHPTSMLGPARWTCGLLITVGVLLLLFGGCFGAVTGMMGMPEFQEAMEKGYREAGGEQNMSFAQFEQAMRIVIIGLAIASGVGAIVAIAAGLWARNGARGGLIASIAVSSLIILASLIFALMTLPVGLCMFGVPLLLCIASLITAIKAMGNARQIEMQNVQMQMWQQQQAYAYQQQQQQQSQGQ